MRRSREKNPRVTIKTETGNRARKVSGTQGMLPTKLWESLWRKQTPNASINVSQAQKLEIKVALELLENCFNPLSQIPEERTSLNNDVVKVVLTLISIAD